MNGPTDRRQRVVLGVATALVLLALAVALATPYLDLPVGTATATGASMGYEGMQVVAYVDTPFASVEVGDTVVYRDDNRLVHHRVVGHTPRGYVTKGDAVATTDQSRGAPYVTDANLVGVVVFRMPLDIAMAALAVLGGAWLALLWWLRPTWWPGRTQTG